MPCRLTHGGRHDGHQVFKQILHFFIFTGSFLLAWGSTIVYHCHGSCPAAGAAVSLQPLRTTLCCWPAFCVFLLSTTSAMLTNQPYWQLLIQSASEYFNPWLWKTLCQIVAYLCIARSCTRFFACFLSLPEPDLPVLLPGQPATLPVLTLTLPVPVNLCVRLKNFYLPPCCTWIPTTEPWQLWDVLQMLSC